MKSSLAATALRSAIALRSPAGTICHSDRGSQVGSWAFTKRARDSGLLASMGSIGDCYDNSMIEAFWSRMQVELLDRKKWNTRLALANAIFEYLEVWHNRKRRHGQLGWLTPIEFERNRIITVA
jgi:transposase InsO family protein